MLVPLACPFVVFGQLLWIVRVYGATPQASLEPNRLPQVDLGYAVYQASSYNTTGNFHSFNNLRYAAPPLGPLRFAAPQPPLDERGSSRVNDSVRYVCPQAGPAWFGSALQELMSRFPSVIPDFISPPQSEDCLFLDVITPKNFTVQDGKPLLPVLVWFHGGGYVAGDRYSQYPAPGLMHASQEGIVYVAVGYRLGAFGFLSDPSNRSSPVANAGILDQRQALKWTQQHIKAFGGDPTKVTIMGESAGAGSVMHHTTAYGGARADENKWFRQAIVQSPYVTRISKVEQQQAAGKFLDAAGVKSVEEARKLPTEVLMSANAKVVGSAPPVTFAFGPVVDDDLIPALPETLYTRGKYNRDVNVIVSHNSDEGLLLAVPYADAPPDLVTYLRSTYPTFRNSTLRYIADTLYPAIYDGSQPYTNPFGRLSLTLGDTLLTCNMASVNRAYGSKVYDYIFSVPPGIHVQDLKYTFFNGETTAVNTAIAHDLQGWITRFVETGDPNAFWLPKFPKYGPRGLSMNLTEAGAFATEDRATRKRCSFWRQALTETL